MQNYSNLWHIEKAFRISKTDLKIRPIYHHKKRRIEAHISISFVAYAIYKELERILEKYNTKISTIKALEELKTIYGLEYVNPITKEKRFEVLKFNPKICNRKHKLTFIIAFRGICEKIAHTNKVS